MRSSEEAWLSVYNVGRTIIRFNGLRVCAFQHDTVFRVVPVNSVLDICYDTTGAKMYQRLYFIWTTSVTLRGYTGIHRRVLVFQKQLCLDLCLGGQPSRCNFKVICDRSVIL